jgi:hypothetical protein
VSLSDLAAIGSFVSGISALITLVFLVVQIRQANQNQRAMVQQGRATRIADFLLRVIDPALLPAWTMGLKGAVDIGSDRYFQFLYMARVRFLSLEEGLRSAGMRLEFSLLFSLCDKRCVRTFC